MDSAVLRLIFSRLYSLVRLYNPVTMHRLRSSALMGLAATVSNLSVDLLRFLKVAVRSRSSLVAENLFLRKQLAFCQEREVKPRRLTDAARIALVFWSRWFAWKQGVDHRPARDPDSVAPPRVQAVLALEVDTGKAAPAPKPSRADCENGKGESNVGAGPRRLGTVSETRHLRLPTDRAGVLALGAGSAMPKNILATLAGVRPQSCSINRRQ